MTLARPRPSVVVTVQSGLDIALRRLACVFREEVAGPLRRHANLVARCD